MKSRSVSILDLLARTGVADLRPEQFNPDAARRLRRAQINGTMKQMRVMMPCNTFFAPALSFQAWNSGVNGLVVVWTSAMVLFSWWLIRAWRVSYPSPSSRKDMQRFILETYVNSGLWALGFAFFYPVVDGDQKAIITAIMAGTLAIGTIGFSRCPGAAFAYAIMQTIGNTSTALLTGAITGAYTDYIIAFLGITAGASVLTAVVERGKASVMAFSDHEKLAEKNEVIDLLLKDYEEQATRWVWQTDAQGCVVLAPAQIIALLQITETELTKTTLLSVVAEKATDDCKADIDKLRRAMARRTDFHDITLSLHDTVTNQLRWIVIKGRPQFADGMFQGFRGIFADATATVEAKRQVQYMATHDSLTDLNNRSAVKRNLAALDEDLHHAAALLIDLDGFKQINDSYGHQVGDRLLEIVAKRLKEAAPSDSFIARLGGDEFFVLQSGPRAFPENDIALAATNIVGSLSQTYAIDSFRLQISASVGIARFPENTRVGTDLLLMADLALYEAKNNGRNRSEFFHADLQAALNTRLAITEKLKSAVHEGKIRPYYQSQHDLKDGSLIGFEALARWYDDELGGVGPDIFIPIAEQTGLIVTLGEQILRQACLDAVQWLPYLPKTGPAVSVNFSPVQFNHVDVPETVARILAETGLPANRLEIEVTESVLINDRARIAQTLTALSDMGVSIALDDFGTGYSSLSYLRDLPLNRLKIDQSFVSDLTVDATNPIVEAVVQLGGNLGLSVIAEGIEDESQRSKLRNLGCVDGQGFHFGRPLPFDAAIANVIEQANGKLARTG